MQVFVTSDNSPFSLQVQLQNLMTSKYIAYFLEEVSGWQKKLSTSDQVIGIWFEVQRTWSHLESIFIGSADIRNQLPEDSKRFDSIDTDFKVRVTGRLSSRCSLCIVLVMHIDNGWEFGGGKETERDDLGGIGLGIGG